MKITKQRLQQIIKEELESSLVEQAARGVSVPGLEPPPQTGILVKFNGQQALGDWKKGCFRYKGEWLTLVLYNGRLSLARLDEKGYQVGTMTIDTGDNGIVGLFKIMISAIKGVK